MSKAKFTYDESGATFFYFVLSFLALILVPSTYYLWPDKSQEGQSKTECRCNGCRSKNKQLEEVYKWKRSRRRFVRTLIVIGWIVFAVIAYKCATAKHEYVNWDPFEILGISEHATASEIKKAYRKLSLIHHPDKGSGDPDKFVKITKAYAALTDDEARKNWELYGNPDGPGATSFGIALPSWIVEKENSFVVLGIYALIFMVALPVSVGIWWYRSVKFGSDKVLINTSEIFYHFINKTPNMALKRVIMILAASLEFSKSHNPEVVERPTDNQEVPRLIRELPLLGEKNTERPLCFSYSIKARAILHAHMSRMKLHPSLELDRCFIVRKCPYLLREFIHCISHLITLALSGRVQNMPNLVTLENAMKLSPLIIQAMWEYQNPLLQLPHFTEDSMKQLERKKIRIKSIEHLAKMGEIERRESLKIFSDEQYEDIRQAIGMMPLIQIDHMFTVLDDEDPNVITAGSIVTAAIKLKRKPMSDLFADGPNECKTQSEVKSTNESQEGCESIAKDQSEYQDKIETNTQSEKSASSDEDNDDDWNKRFQEKVNKKQVFESKSKKSHPVHCPYYPDDKQEFWWIYIVDRKRSALVTAPLVVTSLVDMEEVELKFTATNVGVFSYIIVVRSDSYTYCVVQKQARIEVKPAKEYIEPIYDIPDDEIEVEEDEEHSSVEDSDLLTDNDED